jgi:hypothetical protein
VAVQLLAAEEVRCGLPLILSGNLHWLKQV